MAHLVAALLLCIIPYAMQPVSAAVDATLQPKAKGADVVRATIRKIHNSCIFPNDFQFLLRISWYESRFGDHPDTFRTDEEGYGKGLWQLDEIGFNDTKLLKRSVLSSVKQKLGIDWNKMTYASANMNIPLYNGLAARLLLARKPPAIPPSLEAQANYYKTYYNSAAGKGTEDEFIRKVKLMPNICNTVGADLLFILDASGSIGSSNFQLMKQVLIEVAKKLSIGPDATQMAVITFASSIKEQFGFKKYSTRGSLTSAIQSLTYSGGGTGTDEALDRVELMFQSARALNMGFPRVVIVLTDGQSNNPTATRLAAEKLNKYSWLERYAVGMGTGVDKSELESIAPVCSHVYFIQSVSAISGLTDDLYDLACRSSVALPVGQAGYSTISGTLPSGTSRNVRDTEVSRITGRTYTLKLTSGRATLYVSLSMENPSSALNDYSVEAMPKSPGVVFVSSRELAASDPVSRRKRELSGNSTTNSSSTSVLYLSIVPNTDSGSVKYQLEARDGDHRSFDTKSVMGRPLGWHWSKLALIVAMTIFAISF